MFVKKFSCTVVDDVEDGTRCGTLLGKCRCCAEKVFLSLPSQKMETVKGWVGGNKVEIFTCAEQGKECRWREEVHDVEMYLIWQREKWVSVELDDAEVEWGLWRVAGAALITCIREVVSLGEAQPTTKIGNSCLLFRLLCPLG